MSDDRRMHEGRSRSEGEPRGGERNEEPFDQGEGRVDGEGREAGAPGGETSDMRDRAQESALGGDVATRSSTREGPDEAEQS